MVRLGRYVFPFPLLRLRADVKCVSQEEADGIMIFSLRQVGWYAEALWAVAVVFGLLVPTHPCVAFCR